MAYNIYYVLFMGFAFWVHLIGICGGLRQEHFCEIRGVLATVLWLDPNIHLDYWSNTLNTILDLRQLTLGIGNLVNRCFADLEVYMPNDQS